jgi:hypothetical protein
MNLRLHAVKLLLHLHTAILQPDDGVMRELRPKVGDGMKG